MSQAGMYDLNGIIIPVQTLTGDIGGPIVPIAGNIDLLGGANITTTGDLVTASITFDLTGTTDHAIQVGNATGSLTSLAVGTAYQIIMSGGAGADPDWSTATYPDTTLQGDIIYSSLDDTLVTLSKDTNATRYLSNTGASNNPAWAQVDLTNGVTGVLPPINGGSNDQQVIYVAKTGDDANDGLNISKAKLTFNAALAAADAAGIKSVMCLDGGSYTEDIVGFEGISIYAPHATISGQHVIESNNKWVFLKANIATGEIGFTLGTGAAVGIELFISQVSCSGTGNFVSALDSQANVVVDFLNYANGIAFFKDDAGFLQINVQNTLCTGTGAFCDVVETCSIFAIIDIINDFGSGTLVSSTGDRSPTFNIIGNRINISNLSTIDATTIVLLNVNELLGTLTESGAGTVSRVGGAQRIDGVPIGAQIPSTGYFTTAQITTSTPHGLLVGEGASDIVSLAAATNGQIVIGSTGVDPVVGNLTSSDGTITVTEGAGTLNIGAGGANLISTGFATWDGGAPYYDDTTLGSFTISQSGTGYINSVPITWAAPQTITGMVSGSTYYIYIDNTGTIGKTAVASEALYQNNIVLFEVLRDSTPVTNNQITVKENHPYDFPVTVSYYNHEIIGTVIENILEGANITVLGSDQLQIVGDDQLSDHGLYTDIPDSAGAAIDIHFMYTDALGKWAVDSITNTFPSVYNNAGTVTALGASKYGVFRIYVSKDDLNSTTPTYFAVIDDAQYNNLNAADTAISIGATAGQSAELEQLELAQLGYVIYEESSSSIVEVIIEKATLRQTISTNGTNVSQLITTDTTNFNHILSASDTTVQAALETIDDLILRADGPTDAQASSAVFTIAGGAGITTSAAGSTVTISASGGGGITWNVITADLNPMVVNNGYICNKAGLLTVTLPSTAAAGTVLRVTGINTDLGWKIAQNAGQTIYFGNLSTTTGAGGSLASTLKRDTVELVCVVANTDWNVISSVGNITVV